MTLTVLIGWLTHNARSRGDQCCALIVLKRERSDQHNKCTALGVPRRPEGPEHTACDCYECLLAEWPPPFASVLGRLDVTSSCKEKYSRIVDIYKRHRIRFSSTILLIAGESISNFDEILTIIRLRLEVVPIAILSFLNQLPKHSFIIKKLGNSIFIAFQPFSYDLIYVCHYWYS